MTSNLQEGGCVAGCAAVGSGYDVSSKGVMRDTVSLKRWLGFNQRVGQPHRKTVEFRRALTIWGGVLSCSRQRKSAQLSSDFNWALHLDILQSSTLEGWWDLRFCDRVLDRFLRKWGIGCHLCSWCGSWKMNAGTRTTQSMVFIRRNEGSAPPFLIKWHLP